MTNQSLGEV